MREFLHIVAMVLLVGGCITEMSGMVLRQSDLIVGGFIAVVLGFGLGWGAA